MSSIQLPNNIKSLSFDINSSVTFTKHFTCIDTAIDRIDIVNLPKHFKVDISFDFYMHDGKGSVTGASNSIDLKKSVETHAIYFAKPDAVNWFMQNLYITIYYDPQIELDKAIGSRINILFTHRGDEDDSITLDMKI